MACQKSFTLPDFKQEISDLHIGKETVGAFCQRLRHREAVLERADSYAESSNLKVAN